VTASPRVGWGYDAHRIGGSGPIRLCGVDVPSDVGLLGTSDGDVALHAVIDAILGAAALGDIGELFPSGDPEWEDADSLDLLSIARSRVEAAGFSVTSIDVTVIAESVRVSPHRAAMRRALAAGLDVDVSCVSVKATSTDEMGWIGRGEGIAANAVATLNQA
jgi:2-C-methyl-D-erythritol 2,4-cyclodiphosphate synthase